jgi:histidinol dehydrogenase
VKLSQLKVTQDEIASAYNLVSQELLSALKLAGERIADFHRKEKCYSWIDFSEGALGQIIRPLERVGVYIPGGTASYPSSVLMSVIPARIAGVKEIFLTTPPQKDGSLPPSVLIAADIAQASSIFKIGGAAAIAALALGTQSIPKVDKICGAGNIFVQLAKKSLYGKVDVDGIYGPTETIIIADETAQPSLCAADLLAQAEHDPLASAILLTPSKRLAQEVAQEITRQLEELPRKGIALASLKNRGGIIIIKDIEQAIELANYYAPEHLSLMIADAWSYLDKIKHAGGVFIGENSPEVIGDYLAGPSHVMPTWGSSRYSSPLSVATFLKATSLVAINAQTLKKLGPAASALARAEGFEGHARSLQIRGII